MVRTVRIEPRAQNTREQWFILRAGDFAVKPVQILRPPRGSKRDRRSKAVIKYNQTIEQLLLREI